MINFFIAFFAGFFFFPVFMRFIYPALLDMVIGFAEKERERLDDESE